MLVLHRRLAKQVSVLYEDVLRLLSCDPLRSHFDRSWTAHVQVKATLYDVESQLQMGVQLHKDDEIGAEIARLKVGPDRRCSISTAARTWSAKAQRKLPPRSCSQLVAGHFQKALEISHVTMSDLAACCCRRRTGCC